MWCFEIRPLLNLAILNRKPRFRGSLVTQQRRFPGTIRDPRYADFCFSCSLASIFISVVTGRYLPAAQIGVRNYRTRLCSG